ncbi:peptide chain release factor 2 [Calderihabitans maritimus]|uniref:peptide chain release factor 2 n=1 Tax=Calderihabitans maritimus TaxID=1246530 RepID=UPI001864E8C4|nr:peptide chain release factor 2 [Calderihabitans maritimus]
MLADLKRELENLKKRLEEMRVSLDLERKVAQVKALEEKVMAPDFWENRQEARETLQELTLLKEKVKEFEGLQERLDEALILWELAMEEEDETQAEEISRIIGRLNRELDKLELATLLSGPYDRNNAILSLHPGAGGTESQDWAEMLLRMYSRWAEDKGYEVQILDLLPGDEAGIKSATILIKGENAYGYLKAEKGVHRLVRISPFDASGRRHTSFVSVDVIPELETEQEIEIDPAELKIDTFRASGAGGQHVNKTESAVRITHLPTGIVVQCQNERSQHANRLAAMKILQAKLFELKRREQEEEVARLRGEQHEIAWGNQIRSYVFHPYSLVKDHRTNLEVGNVEAVMDGKIDEFIAAYLRKSVVQK